MALKGHTFKMDEEPWARFLAKTSSRGRTASEILVASVMLYLDDDAPENADELDKASDAYECRPKEGRPRKEDTAD